MAAGSEGFASIDALVALMIIATTLCLTFPALNAARRAGAQADEIARADLLLSELSGRRDDRLGEVTGEADGFVWTARTQVTGMDRPIPVCRRAVALSSAASGRRYVASTLQPCPAEL